MVAITADRVAARRRALSEAVAAQQRSDRSTIEGGRCARHCCGCLGLARGASAPGSPARNAPNPVPAWNLGGGFSGRSRSRSQMHRSTAVAGWGHARPNFRTSPAPALSGALRAEVLCRAVEQDLGALGGLTRMWMRIRHPLTRRARMRAGRSGLRKAGPGPCHGRSATPVAPMFRQIQA